MPNVGPLEIGIVLIIALIVFGPKKLPELGNSLGKGIREFKGSLGGEHDDDEQPRLTPSGEAQTHGDPAADSEALRNKSA